MAGRIQALTMTLLTVPMMVVASTSASGEDSVESIEISEIHYNPSGTNSREREFLELHNLGQDPVDLSGYEFTDGIGVVFGQVTIPAGGYVVIAPDVNTTDATYGVSPVATYSGKLSNKGETVTLMRGDHVVDSVTYDDGGQWPEEADGGGSSLELSAGFDNSSPASWVANGSEPTPAAANTIWIPPATGVFDLAIAPSRPDVGESMTVSVQVTGGETPTLTYLVGFGDPVVTPMTPTSGGVRIRLDDSWSGCRPTNPVPS